MATAAIVRATVQGLSVTGQVTVHGWSGWIPDLQSVIDPIQRLGASGTGAQETARAGRKVEISGWRLDSAIASVLTLCSLWETFEGKIVRVTDPWGRILQRVRLTNCIAGPPRTCRGSLDEGGVAAVASTVFTAIAERQPDNG